jgi:hypothetical protein
MSYFGKQARPGAIARRELEEGTRQPRTDVERRYLFNWNSDRYIPGNPCSSRREDNTRRGDAHASGENRHSREELTSSRRERDHDSRHRSRERRDEREYLSRQRSRDGWREDRDRHSPHRSRDVRSRRDSRDRVREDQSHYSRQHLEERHLSRDTRSRARSPVRDERFGLDRHYRRRSPSPRYTTRRETRRSPSPYTTRRERRRSPSPYNARESRRSPSPRYTATRESRRSPSTVRRETQRSLPTSTTQKETRQCQTPPKKRSCHEDAEQDGGLKRRKVDGPVVSQNIPASQLELEMHRPSADTQSLEEGTSTSVCKSNSPLTMSHLVPASVMDFEPAFPPETSQLVANDLLCTPLSTHNHLNCDAVAIEGLDPIPEEEFPLGDCEYQDQDDVLDKEPTSSQLSIHKSENLYEDRQEYTSAEDNSIDDETFSFDDEDFGFEEEKHSTAQNGCSQDQQDVDSVIVLSSDASSVWSDDEEISSHLLGGNTSTAGSLTTAEKVANLKVWWIEETARQKENMIKLSKTTDDPRLTYNRRVLAKKVAQIIHASQEICSVPTDMYSINSAGKISLHDIFTLIPPSCQQWVASEIPEELRVGDMTDLASQTDPCWLSSGIIACLIALQSNEWLPTSTFQFGLGLDCNESTNEWCVKNENRTYYQSMWNRAAKGLQDSDEDLYTIDIRYKDIAFFWNFTEAHWTVVHVSNAQEVLNEPSRQYTMYNSSHQVTKDGRVLGSSAKTCRDSIPIINNLIQHYSGWPQLAGDSGEANLDFGESPQQENSWDCGIFSIYNATELLAGRQPETNVSPTELRVQYLDLVLQELTLQLSCNSRVEFDKAFAYEVPVDMVIPGLQEVSSSSSEGSSIPNGKDPLSGAVDSILPDIEEDNNYIPLEERDVANDAGSNTSDDKEIERYWEELDTSDDLEDPADLTIVLVRKSGPYENGIADFRRQLIMGRQLYYEHWAIHGQADFKPQEIVIPEEPERADDAHLGLVVNIATVKQKLPAFVVCVMAPQTSANNMWTENYRRAAGSVVCRAWEERYIKAMLVALNDDDSGRETRFRARILQSGFDASSTHEAAWITTIQTFPRIYWRLTIAIKPTGLFEPDSTLVWIFKLRGRLLWGYFSVHALACLRSETEKDQYSGQRTMEGRKHMELLQFLKQVDKWKRSKWSGYEGDKVEKPSEIGQRNTLDVSDPPMHQCEDCNALTSSGRWYRGTTPSSIRCSSCELFNPSECRCPSSPSFENDDIIQSVCYSPNCFKYRWSHAKWVDCSGSENISFNEESLSKSTKRIPYCIGARCSNQANRQGQLCSSCYRTKRGTQYCVGTGCSKLACRAGQLCDPCYRVKTGTRFCIGTGCSNLAYQPGQLCDSCFRARNGTKYCVTPGCPNQSQRKGQLCKACYMVKNGTRYCVTPKCSNQSQRKGQLCNTCYMVKNGTRYCVTPKCSNLSQRKGQLCTSCYVAKNGKSYCVTPGCSNVQAYSKDHLCFSCYRSRNGTEHCATPGCSNVPQGRGQLCKACFKAKNGTLYCVTPKCSNLSQRKGQLCTSCYRAKNGKQFCVGTGCSNLAYQPGQLCDSCFRARNGTKYCVTPGCPNQSQRKGQLCESCYRSRNITKHCATPGCSNVPQRKGQLCRTCFNAKNGPEYCVTPGCPNLSQRKGRLCDSCYGKEHGFKVCVTPGCPNRSQRKGQLCRSCYKRSLT